MTTTLRPAVIAPRRQRDALADMLDHLWREIEFARWAGLPEAEQYFTREWLAKHAEFQRAIGQDAAR